MASSQRTSNTDQFPHPERVHSSHRNANQNDERTNSKLPSFRKSVNKFDQLLHRMSDDQIEDELQRRNLSTMGSSEVLRARLRNHHRLSLSFRSPNPFAEIEQKFRYIIVIDFEATCDKQGPVPFQHEIIEFPLVLIDTKQWKIVDQFQSYCRPIRNPILSEFCKKLTGITQEQVDSAPNFAQVFQNVQNWLNERNLTGSHSNHVAFASDSPSDFAKFLRFQCHLSDIPYPEMIRQWIDIHRAFAGFYSTSSCGLTRMLKHLGLKFDGHHHSGLDDAKNIARIALAMIKDGCVLSFNDSLREDDPRYLSLFGESVAAVAQDEDEEEDDDGIVFQDETDN